VGARNWSLARAVDEIPDFHPPVPPATSKPLLVFLDLENPIPVCLEEACRCLNRAEETTAHSLRATPMTIDLTMKAMARKIPRRRSRAFTTERWRMNA